MKINKFLALLLTASVTTGFAKITVENNFSGDNDHIEVQVDNAVQSDWTFIKQGSEKTFELKEEEKKEGFKSVLEEKKQKDIGKKIRWRDLEFKKEGKYWETKDDYVDGDIVQLTDTGPDKSFYVINRIIIKKEPGLKGIFKKKKEEKIQISREAEIGTDLVETIPLVFGYPEAGNIYILKIASGKFSLPKHVTDLFNAIKTDDNDDNIEEVKKLTEEIEKRRPLSSIKALRDFTLGGEDFYETPLYAALKNNALDVALWLLQEKYKDEKQQIFLALDAVDYGEVLNKLINYFASKKHFIARLLEKGNFKKLTDVISLMIERGKGEIVIDEGLDGLETIKTHLSDKELARKGKAFVEIIQEIIDQTKKPQFK
ncbi:hypothetical protein ACFLYA_01920 [Candidatus Dependentiae bacterium]